MHLLRKARKQDGLLGQGILRKLDFPRKYTILNPMKIERINENQIRCILTKEDLENRKIKFSELTYGSEKATDLFRDVMLEANRIYGFETGNQPLMIEAVPMQSGMIVFLITKVPGEANSSSSISSLDFFDSADDADGDVFDDDNSNNPPVAHSTTIRIGGNISSLPSLGQTIRDLFQEMLSFDAQNNGSNSSAGNAAKAKAPSAEETDRVYLFDSLADVIDLSLAAGDLSCGNDCLYKDTSNGKYCLLLIADSFPPAAFRQLCTLAADFSSSEIRAAGFKAHMDELYEPIIRSHALEKLSEIK